MRYQGLQVQYAFDAERRCIDPCHNIMWVDDALSILVDLQQALDNQPADGDGAQSEAENPLAPRTDSIAQVDESTAFYADLDTILSPRF